MRQEFSIIIADTSCFILLDKIDEMDILRKVFQRITTTQEIAIEYGKNLPSWIEIRAVVNREYEVLLQLEVDGGEASAIALSIEIGNALLIIDDNKARKLAAKLQLAYTGTLGVILKAKQSGFIPAIKPVIQKIQRTNFRFSESIYKEILMLAGETSD
jgi:predicted nucleic acid-binding protein